MRRESSTRTPEVARHPVAVEALASQLDDSWIATGGRPEVPWADLKAPGLGTAAFSCIGDEEDALAGQEEEDEEQYEAKYFEGEGKMEVQKEVQKELLELQIEVLESKELLAFTTCKFELQV